MRSISIRMRAEQSRRSAVQVLPTLATEGNCQHRHNYKSDPRRLQRDEPKTAKKELKIPLRSTPCYTTHLHIVKRSSNGGALDLSGYDKVEAEFRADTTLPFDANNIECKGKYSAAGNYRAPLASFLKRCTLPEADKAKFDPILLPLSRIVNNIVCTHRREDLTIIGNWNVPVSHPDEFPSLPRNMVGSYT